MHPLHFTSDLWPTLLISLCLRTSGHMCEYFTSIFPLAHGLISLKPASFWPAGRTWSGLHCMKSLQSFSPTNEQVQGQNYQGSEKYPMAFPAQRRTGCFGHFNLVVKFFRDCLSPFRPQFFWNVDPDRVRSGVVSSAYPEISCFHPSCFCIPFSKHYLLQNNSEVSEKLIRCDEITM